MHDSDERLFAPRVLSADLFNVPSDQVIKSRIQSAPTGTYSGMLDCVRKTIAQDGIRALWKGAGPAMARVRSLSTLSC
jgi:hypothetical protein